MEKNWSILIAVCFALLFIAVGVWHHIDDKKQEAKSKRMLEETLLRRRLATELFWKNTKPITKEEYRKIIQANKRNIVAYCGDTPVRQLDMFMLSNHLLEAYLKHLEPKDAQNLILELGRTEVERIAQVLMKRMEGEHVYEIKGMP